MPVLSCRQVDASSYWVRWTYRKHVQRVVAAQKTGLFAQLHNYRQVHATHQFICVLHTCTAIHIPCENFEMPERRSLLYNGSVVHGFAVTNVPEPELLRADNAGVNVSFNDVGCASPTRTTEVSR